MKAVLSSSLAPFSFMWRIRKGRTVTKPHPILVYVESSYRNSARRRRMTARPSSRHSAWPRSHTLRGSTGPSPIAESRVRVLSSEFLSDSVKSKPAHGDARPRPTPGRPGAVAARLARGSRVAGGRARAVPGRPRDSGPQQLFGGPTKYSLLYTL